MTSRFILSLIGLVLALPLWAADTAPKPTDHFTDQVGWVTADQAATFNHQLADYERQTSNQFLVAILTGYPDGADYQQYSIDSFHAWQVGIKGKDNGVVLFIYPKQHQMFIATGRGLEGALPDATCNEILTLTLRPYLQKQDYVGGLTAAIAAVEKAASGEYKGTGQTVAEGSTGASPSQASPTHASNPGDKPYTPMQIIVGVLVIMAGIAFFLWLNYVTDGGAWGFLWIILDMLSSSGSGGGRRGSDDSYRSGGGDNSGGGAGDKF